MRERLSDYQEQYGDLYNLEATPAESTTYRLAKHDVAALPRYHHRRTSGGTPYYTNSSPPARGLHGGHLRRAGHSGRAPDALHLRHGVPRLPGRKAARLAGRGQHWCARSRRTTSCPTTPCRPPIPSAQNHGYLAGEQFTCPICGEKTEVYSRITGYYRPVQNWNDGKSQEYQGQKNLSGERCGAAPCSRSGERSERDRARFGESRPLHALRHGHLPQLPGGKAAAAKGGRSL